MIEQKHQRIILLIMTITSMLIPFMMSAVNIALPMIGRDLHADAVLLSWIATSYLLASAFFILPLGRLADIYGRKKIFSTGLLLFTAASLMVGLAPTITVLLIGRALQGFGAAMMFATSVAILTSVFPPSERGRVLGLNVSSVYIGLSLGPVLGGLLTQYAGWRSIFYLMVPTCAIIWFMLRRHLQQEWRESQGERFDVIGASLFSVTVSTLLYGLSSLPKPTGFIIIAIGLAGGVMFLVRQVQVSHPIMDVRLFRSNRTFTLSSLAAFINYGATTSVVFLLSLYLQYLKGLSPRSAGLLLVIAPVMQAVTSPIAGRLSDRIAPQRLASAGMGLTVLGLLMLIPLRPDSALLYLLACLFILGLGFGLFSSPNTNAIMSAVERRNYGIASAMVSAMRLLGQMFSMGFATLVLNHFVGRQAITPEVHPQFQHSMQAIFTVAAMVCFIGVFASLARGNLRANPN